MEDQTPIERLEAALNDSNQPDTRRTFGNVEYAMIPIAVIEAVLDADALITEDFEEPVADEAEEPTPEDNDGDMLVIGGSFRDGAEEPATEETAVEIGVLNAGLEAREVAVVETPTDPSAGFPNDGSVEVAVPSDNDFDVEDVDVVAAQEEE